VYAGGRRIATFEPQSTACQALGLPAKWDQRLERLGRALTWPFRHGYQPAVVLAFTLLGLLALVVGPVCNRSTIRFGAKPGRGPKRVLGPMDATCSETVSGRVENPSHVRVAWAWLTSFLPTYRQPRRPSPYEAPLVLGAARAWWQRAVAAVTMAALVMAQTPARAESPLPAGCFYYHLADHLGSSNVITYRDGLQAQHFENGVFGREVHEQHGSTHQLSARYTGQLFDEETGLYYYGARYYDPELGRFTQADTIVPDPGDGQSLNRYSYANNNPLKYTDPSGHVAWFVPVLIGIAVGAGLGAATTAATGGNLGMGILTGAIGGLFGGLGSALAPFGSQFLGAVAGSALGGAVNSAITGGNVGLGALSGAIAGVIGFGAAKLQIGLWGAATPQNWVDDLTGFAVSAGAGALGGGLGAAIQGGDFGQGALGGAIGGAIAYGLLVDLPDALQNRASANPRFHLFAGLLGDAWDGLGALLTGQDGAWSGFGEGAVEGLAAAADGANPFGDPLAKLGAYDATLPQYKFSQTMGGVAGFAAGGGVAQGGMKALGAGRLLAKAPLVGKGGSLFGRRYLDANKKWVGQHGLLNKGEFRIGWGWNGSKDVFRIAVGSPTKRPLIEYLRHLDF
jgi:RHS repeat-associated protein